MKPLDFVRPAHWSKLVNPLRPSWGEAYAEIAERMSAAIADARAAARGHEAVIVSHQLPIWTARNAADGQAAVARPAQARVPPRLADHPHLRRRRRSSRSPTPSPPPSLLAQSHGGTG